MATPSHVATVLWRDDENPQRLRFSSTRSGNYDLGKLAKLRELGDQVEAGFIPPGKGLERLRAITQAAPEYGPAITALAYMLCGVGFAGILRTSWLEAVLGGLLSLVSFGATLRAVRSPRIAIATELLSAFVAYVVASIIARILPINPLSVTLCAVIWFVPGFGLTVAPYEMIYGNALSGLTWLTNAVLALLKLLGGTALGIALVQILWHSAPLEPMARLSPVWSWAFVPLLVLGLAILFRVQPKDIVWVSIGGLLTRAGIQMGKPIGYWQGTLLGALLLCVYANWSQRKIQILGAAILLPDIMLAVPGAVALRAVSLAERQGFLTGLKAAHEALIIIACILAGLLAGNLVLPATEGRAET